MLHHLRLSLTRRIWLLDTTILWLAIVWILWGVWSLDDDLGAGHAVVCTETGEHHSFTGLSLVTTRASSRLWKLIGHLRLLTESDRLALCSWLLTTQCSTLRRSYWTWDNWCVLSFITGILWHHLDACWHLHRCWWSLCLWLLRLHLNLSLWAGPLRLLWSHLWWSWLRCIWISIRWLHHHLWLLHSRLLWSHTLSLRLCTRLLHHHRLLRHHDGLLYLSIRPRLLSHHHLRLLAHRLLHHHLWLLHARLQWHHLRLITSWLALTITHHRLVCSRLINLCRIVIHA